MKLQKNNFKKFKLISLPTVGLFLLLIVLTITSCRLQDDLNKIVVKVPTQTIAIPMISSRLSMADLLAVNPESTEEYLNIDEDSFITVVYAMDIEMPAVSGLDEIVIADISISDAIQMGALPPIADLSLPGDTISFRNLIGDGLADTIKLLQAGIDSTVCIDTAGTIDTTICIDTAGVIDTTICIDTSVTLDTTLCVDTSVEFPELSGNFVDTTICVDTSITFDTTLCGDTSIAFDTTLCLDTSIDFDTTICADVFIAPITVFPYPDTLIGPEPAEEIPFDLQGFSSVTMESGILTMIIKNNFPFALTNVRFDMMNKTGPNIGTFTFLSDIEPMTTDSQQIDLSNQILTDTILFQLISLGTGGDSGAINVDSAMMSIGITARNMSILGATGVLPSDTLAMDSMKTVIDLPDSTMQISRAQLGAGSFDYTFVSKFATDITIELSIPSLSDVNQNPFVETIILDYQGEDSTVAIKSISLIDYNLDLSQDSINVYYFAYLTNPDDPVTLATSDEFSFSVDLAGIKVNYAEGYFGRMDLPSIADTMNLGLYNSQYSGSIRFAEPSISVNFENSFGLPIDLDVNLMGYNLISGDSAPVVVNGQVGFPTTPGQTISSSVVIDEESGLDDFFELSPNIVQISMDVVTNPDGPTSLLNFITDSAAISVGVGLEIPFYGSIKNLVLMDTMDFSVGEDLEVSTNAVFHLSTLNDFPASLGLQVYFADANYNILDSLITPYQDFFESAKVNDNGETIEATERYTAIPFNEDRLSNIRSAKNLIIKGSMITAENGTTDVRFYSYQGFSIQLGVQVDVSLELIESLSDI